MITGLPGGDRGSLARLLGGDSPAHQSDQISNLQLNLPAILNPGQLTALHAGQQFLFADVQHPSGLGKAEPLVHLLRQLLQILQQLVK